MNEDEHENDEDEDDEEDEDEEHEKHRSRSTCFDVAGLAARRQPRQDGGAVPTLRLDRNHRAGDDDCQP